MALRIFLETGISCYELDLGKLFVGKVQLSLMRRFNLSCH